jgi:hypothetical protein
MQFHYFIEKLNIKYREDDIKTYTRIGSGLGPVLQNFLRQ